MIPDLWTLVSTIALAHDFGEVAILAFCVRGFHEVDEVAGLYIRYFLIGMETRK